MMTRMMPKKAVPREIPRTHSARDGQQRGKEICVREGVDVQSMYRDMLQQQRQPQHQLHEEEEQLSEQTCVGGEVPGARANRFLSLLSSGANGVPKQVTVTVTVTRDSA